MGYMRLLRRRPVRTLWLSMALSVLGDRLYALAVMWVVYEATGSASLMGLVAVVESLPYIALGGSAALMERFASWRRLARVDAARAVVAMAVPLTWSPDPSGFAVLLVLVLLLGTLGAVFDPNLGALAPELVEPDEVQQVSALFDLTSRIAAVAGPGSVGALLLVVSEIQLFAVDAVTFAVSAVALSRLGRSAAGGGQHSADTGRQETVRARPVIREHPRVGVAIGVHAAGLFVAAVSAVGLPALLASRMGQGAAGYGVALAATATGALAGNLLIGSIPDRWPWLGTYCAAWTAVGTALAALGLVGSLPAVIALCTASGLLIPVSAVTLRTHLSRFPAGVRLRLLTVDQTAIRTAGTAGMLLLPLAVDAAPTRAFVGAGVLLSSVALAGWWAGSRMVDRPVTAKPGAARIPAGTET
ncbi:MFS transporter [Streptomyces sp. AK02-01A]|uniref:MFS transporter n=1 Tax=Streptomyces sp. AK02-01A TaxID=3028648 RepID=UPI0029A1C69C|nr:MFS transporter [Streptomyces sp. AK02-01A]MDX3851310.1 MFS transporter [Streptomyces sp. AK02-01A]